TYARVRCENVYPGVSMVYYGSQHRLEYDFMVAPGADPDAIRLSFEGADGVELDGRGDLRLYSATGEVRQRKPVVYQEMDGQRQPIEGRYVLKGTTPQVTLQVGPYDRSRPLVIDPVLDYSTYLGTGSIDYALGVAVDDSGSAYVTGATLGIGF